VWQSEVVPSEVDLDALTPESLGARLRELRTGAGVSLRALAGRLGISPSAVSQIERGVMRPSVSRLIAYVGAIGVPLSAVFETGIEKAPEGSAGARAAEYSAAPQQTVPERAVSDGTGPSPAAGSPGAGQYQFAIRRSWEVAPIRLGGGVTFRRLSPVPTPGVEFFESTYPPNSMSNAHGELLRHEGYEVGTVTAGELTVDFDTDVVTLGAGDSITYPCSRPHLIANRSPLVTAVATWLIVST
jgi:transcriptional regulator with XRE-family HTH domain/quercetin dioxygenase-like cupin family protein